MTKASILKRWFAVFIENLLLGFALMIPNLMISMGASNDSAAIALVGLLLYFVILIGFLVIQIKFWSQSTSIGKKMLNLKVVKHDTHQPLTLGEMFLREIVGKWLSSILMIGYIMALVDSDNRALHDRIVTSFVVEDTGYDNQNNY